MLLMQFFLQFIIPVRIYVFFLFLRLFEKHFYCTFDRNHLEILRLRFWGWPLGHHLRASSLAILSHPAKSTSCNFYYCVEDRVHCDSQCAVFSVSPVDIRLRHYAVPIDKGFHPSRPAFIHNAICPYLQLSSRISPIDMCSFALLIPRGRQKKQERRLPLQFVMIYEILYNV